MIILLQPLAAIATAAVGATTLILSAASISNMYETHATVQRHHRHHRRLLESHPSSSSSSSSSSSCFVPKSWASIDEALADLSGMNRRDLIELFLNCDPPSDARELAFIDGDEREEEGGGGCWGYDGYLLDNGPILTHVTNFITNRLFGRGEKWLGKAYAKPATSSFDEGGIGRNRFSLSNRASPAAAAFNDKGNESLDRTYAYYIGTSVLPSASTSKSLFHNYAPHCPSWWSPMTLIWRGMVDELRVVPLDSGNVVKDDGRAILLGMGYFSWSGGVMNMAPFCLVARPLTCASEVTDGGIDQSNYECS